MTEITKNPKRLTNEQAAKYLGIAPQSLHNLRHHRRGPDYIKLGRKILYDVNDLDIYLESHRVRLKE